MKKRWKISPANIELQEVLGRELDILPLTAQLLINRGLVEPDKASSFLRPELKDLHEPFLMKDMGKAVDRILKALEGGEKIAVYGDYDVDGTTSTALLHLFFKEIGGVSECYIPCRRTEGYGLNSAALKKLKDAGVSLVITVDCGVSNHEELAYARSIGLDCIVSDHHELEMGAPEGALAVLNPKQNGCAFPFKSLAGVGVAFNLAIALRARLRETGWFVKREEPNLRRYLDLVAVGTIADLVPLVDENRILVSHGLKELSGGARLGLKALVEASGVKPGRLDADSVAFQLAPRINAAGRLGSAMTALRLLITDDAKEAASLAGELNRENSLRQRIEEETLLEALELMKVESGLGIVLAKEGWNPGVIGIVASRLADRFGQPTVMIALEGETGKGSARGVKSFNMLEGLKACSLLLHKYGGHKAAAGLTIARENIDSFRDEFQAHISERLNEDDLTPEIVLDAVVRLDDLDPRFISEIERLAPFGASNREPLLAVADAEILATEVVGSRHLRLKVSRKGLSALSAIGFGLAPLHPMKGTGFGIAFSPYMDEWQGTRNLKLRVKDVRPSV
ncbi:MAG: single-stranded-DNA-specific exonuclease RecJ [Deltaproteobacteria bacterium GWB2_55_19]|nr:MAG: single-stranded-DNA-specific exonuclease RecJ [Deltaproteobacteria bacterium GWB2_55_19]HAO93228.1 single-stranded-DNA-specific exonuclease RecJ [Deltaproteobacteria bacterium]